MIKAIIFDMDGVISNTLPLHAKSESETLLKYGIKISPEELIKRFNAVPDEVMYKKLFASINQEPNFKKVAKKKFDIFQKLASKKIETIPDSIKLIKKLKKNNFALGVASSAPRKIVNLVLKRLGINQLFKVVITPEDVGSNSLKHEIFALNIKGLEINPNECVVIEDAPRGIEAAHKVGMKCIAITTTHKEEELREADKIIDSFDQLGMEDIKNI